MDRVQLEFKGDSVTKTKWEKRLELVDISLDCILSQQLLLNQLVAARTDSSIHLSYHNASELKQHQCLSDVSRVPSQMISAQPQRCTQHLNLIAINRSSCSFVLA